MAKLWDKGAELDRLIERFTAGSDYLLDRRLITADAVASAAHVRMLESIGLLTGDESASLVDALREIAVMGESGSFSVDLKDEDGHTAIENRLVDRLGEVGKKVHSGRSRNDQVLASTRLYTREAILVIRGHIHDLARTLLEFAARHVETPMPGRTHLQPAMPSTVGLWAASFAGLLLDDDHQLASAYALVNRSPLGAAAGYGVPLPLNREMVADLLGFSGPQLNVIAVNNSRGKTEAAVLDAADQVGITLSRFAGDLILFSTPEFGYFRLPPELCTGSSIMPQKQNPDGLELMRGRAGTLSGLATTVKNVVRSLPSGYNRDVQETKGPLMRALDIVIDMVRVGTLTAGRIEVVAEKLEAGFSPEILATDEVFRRVQAGEAFRDAYQAVAKELNTIKSEPDLRSAIRKRTATGTPGNPGLEAQVRTLETRAESVEAEARRTSRAIESLMGRPMKVFTRIDS